MKIESDAGRAIEVFIKWISSGCTWLQIDKFTVGFTSVQLQNPELSLRRIEVITHLEFLIPAGVDVDTWWAGVLTALDAEFKETQLEARRAEAQKRIVRASALRDKRILPRTVSN
jgi:hypothetical protein